LENSLLVVWTSADKEVAEKMIFMYSTNAKIRGWFEEVTILIWGPSSKLTSEDPDIQSLIKKAMDSGVKIDACKACADMYGVADKLIDLGIDVKYAGVPLTEHLKSDGKILTF
jgi:hypothetical protein